MQRSSSEKIIEEKVLKRAREGRISCSQARRIAEELEVSYLHVGEVANKLKVKIVQCELGCF